MLQHIALNELRPGYEVGIDARSGQHGDLAELKASILAHGLLHPLGVWRDHLDRPYVAYGNRRWAALTMLADEGWVADDMQIPCVVITGDAQKAYEASLAENVERMPLHPVQQFVAFAELAEQGASAATIAQRFGIDEKWVRQRLALGRLAPEVRSAWLEGKIRQEAAQQFTLEPDTARQAEILKAMLNKNQIEPWVVRQAIVQDQHSLERYLRFVGRDAYMLAGGRIAEDLFGDKTVILDREIMEKITAETLASYVKVLRDDGWGTVHTEFDEPDDWYRLDKPGRPEFTEEEQAKLDLPMDQFPWEERKRIKEQARIRSLSAEDRAQLQARVRINHDGEVTYELGRGKLSAKPVEASVDSAGTTAPEPDRSEPKKVLDRLRDQLTQALRAAFSDDADASMRLLAATMRSGGQRGGSPLILSHMAPFDATETLATSISAMSTTAEFVEGVARGINCSSDAMARHGVVRSGVEAAASILHNIDLQRTLKACFDAKAYFGGTTRDNILTAIAEALGPEVAAVWTKKKRQAAADWAAEHVAPTGWLPPELRLGSYVQPWQPAEVEPEPEPEKKKRPAKKAKASV